MSDKAKALDVRGLSLPERVIITLLTTSDPPMDMASAMAAVASISPDVLHEATRGKEQAISLVCSIKAGHSG